MTTPAYTVACTQKKIVAPNVYELRFTKPDGLTFKAGQFLLFDVPLADKPEDIQPRALSIASSPDEPDLLFVVKMKDGGRMSRWVEDIVTETMPVRIQGPFGFFTITPNEEHHYIFVATGAGLAPFRSQILWLLKEKFQGKLDLIFGVRDRKDFFWHEELEEAAKLHPNFRLHLSLTGNDDTWDGKKGRVQTILPSLIHNHAATQIYICGAPAMVQDVKKTCLEALKFDKKAVHAEGYI